MGRVHGGAIDLDGPSARPLRVRPALVRGDEPAAVLAQAGRTVALLTGLVRKFA